MGELEKAVEHLSTARVHTAFHTFPNFHLCFYNLIETQNMFSISFRKYSGTKTEINLLTLIIKLLTQSLCQQVVLGLSLLSYRNTVLNQSARIIALGYFLYKLKAWHWLHLWAVLFVIECAQLTGMGWPGYWDLTSF